MLNEHCDCKYMANLSLLCHKLVCSSSSSILPTALAISKETFHELISM